MARKVPEINSSSQADIAFLLLCFFLMTTSMDVDYGITRRLPPPVEQNDEDVKVKERNVMNVMVNKSDKLLVNGRPMDISQLKEEAKHFMTPRPGDDTAPEVEDKTFGEVLQHGDVGRTAIDQQPVALVYHYIHHVSFLDLYILVILFNGRRQTTGDTIVHIH